VNVVWGTYGFGVVVEVLLILQPRVDRWIIGLDVDLGIVLDGMVCVVWLIETLCKYVPVAGMLKICWWMLDLLITKKVL